jgi:hypothetical protein
VAHRTQEPADTGNEAKKSHFGFLDVVKRPSFRVKENNILLLLLLLLTLDLLFQNKKIM